jgi:hypothetical protein
MASDDLADIRRQRMAEKWDLLQQQRNELVEQHRQQRNETSRLAGSGDTYGAQYSDESCEQLENSIQEIDIQLHEMTPQQQLTSTQTDLLNRHGGDLHKAHWSGMPGTNNFHAMQWADQYARANGIDPSSQQYKDIIEVVTPEGGNDLPTPNQLCRYLNLDPKVYNRGVRQLQARKARGDYK